MLSWLKAQANHLKNETYALHIAYKDPRVPWYAKAFAAFIVAHTVSPIDLVPDFIPVIGYLDDLVITPLGLMIALRMIPPEVMDSARQQAAAAAADGKVNTRAGIVIVITTWSLALAVALIVLLRVMQN